ncbi:MAG: Gfo/Idh/MocA family oxidoreductase [Acidimicrobiales bacterium]|nr:Gfo/Idh/MocA family oxidoreductase [Acidimicrobiales bacterium]HRW37190.1 Gfo/Idh/MocA family oxidoreductase [Aquihabitans sp.]
MGDDHTINLLLVGLGRQGRRHARVAQNSGAARIVGTVDPGGEPLPGVPHHPTVEAALAALDGGQRPDAAVIATPIGSHAPLAELLLRAGIAVLVEKPMAASAEEAAHLVAVAEETGTLLAVGHVERFNPSVQLVRAMLADGGLGTPVACSFRRVGLHPPSKPDLDVIHDLAVHDIDVFSVLAGAGAELAGASGWVGGTGLVESAHVLLTAGEVHGLVEVNWRTPVRLRSFTVTTDTCFVQVDYTTQRVEVVQASTEQELEEFAAFQSHYGAAKRTQLEARVAEPLAEQMIEFAAAVRGEPHPHLADGRAGLVAVAVAAEASAQAGAADIGAHP